MYITNSNQGIKTQQNKKAIVQASHTYMYIFVLNLQPFCCIAASKPTRQAPCEKPINPSNGPYSVTTSSISLRVTSKPIAGPPRHFPLYVLSSALNHHERASTETNLYC